MSSDYGGIEEWDEGAEAELLAIERTSSVPSRENNSNDNIAPLRRTPHLDIYIDGVTPVASTSSLPDLGLQESLLATALNALGEDGLVVDEPRSLWERFRMRRSHGASMSVTDLVGPLWCEYQHTYRLSSKAYLPPEARPAEIVTPSGASIPVNLERNILREAILTKGTAVHQTLEDKVMGVTEEVQVDVVTAEDFWSFRCLETIIGLEKLVIDGETRELPVHGFVHGELVFGKIDEVFRRDVKSSTGPTRTSTAEPNSLPKSGNQAPRKVAAVESDASQRKLDTYFSPSPSKKGKEKAFETEGKDTPKSLPTWRYILSDTKTRSTRTLPRRGDSAPAKLQLMLYHSFLSSLLSPSYPPPYEVPRTQPEPFSWVLLYEKRSLDPAMSLSPSFLASIQPMLIGTSVETRATRAGTLQDFVTLLQSYGERLGVSKDAPLIWPVMEISYRLRNDVRKFSRPKKSASQVAKEDLELAIRESLVGITLDEATEEDERQLALAIALSEGTLGEVESIIRSGGISVGEGEGPETDRSISVTIPSLSHVALLPPIDPLPNDDEISSRLSPLPVEGDIFPNSQSLGSLAPAIRISSSSKRRRSLPSPIISPYNTRSKQDSKRIKQVSDATSAIPKSPIIPLPLPSLQEVQPIPGPPSLPPSTSQPDTTKAGALIGTDRFRYDGELLERHLASMMKYWKGEREPVGVAIDQTFKCRSCEFEAGCEWKEKKTVEAVELNRARRQKSS